MPCAILIRATDSLSGGKKKGTGSIVKNPPFVFGGKEQLPDWIRIIVTDADASEFGFFMTDWITIFEVTPQGGPPGFVRLRFRVHPSVISASNVGRDEMKARMSVWAVNNYGATIVNASVSTIIVDFPEPLVALGVPTTVAGITSDFADHFDVRFQRARFFIPDSVVDMIVALPQGSTALTKVQTDALIVDKFTL